MRHVYPNHEIPHLWAHQSQDEARNSTGSLYFDGTNDLQLRLAFSHRPARHKRARRESRSVHHQSPFRHHLRALLGGGRGHTAQTSRSFGFRTCGTVGASYRITPTT